MAYILSLAWLSAYVPENLILGKYVIFSILFIGLVSIGIIFLTGRRPLSYVHPIPPLPWTETDKVNYILAKIRENPDQYDITKKLCNQFIRNHAKRENIRYHEFPFDQPECHMDNARIEKLASMISCIPWTSAIAGTFKVEDGLVCNKFTNEPVKSNAWLINIVASHEEGHRVKISSIEVAIQDLKNRDNNR